MRPVPSVTTWWSSASHLMHSHSRTHTTVAHTHWCDSYVLLMIEHKHIETHWMNTHTDLITHNVQWHTSPSLTHTHRARETGSGKEDKVSRLWCFLLHIIIYNINEMLYTVIVHCHLFHTDSKLALYLSNVEEKRLGIFSQTSESH